MSHPHHWQSLQEAELQRRFAPRIQPKTANQAKYLESIHSKVVTVCMGPAGTGKTFCPASLGLEWLEQGKIKKVVLTRPLVTCSSGNRDALGILPGEMLDKVGPYMRPLLDVFKGRITEAGVMGLIRSEKLDLVPLDVMRGLSFENALIIADEMQNASQEQILCLLTRFAAGSKVVISGAPNQSDLPCEVPPLVMAYHSLGGINDIGRVILTDADVVRHPLVALIEQRLSGGGRTFVMSETCESWYRIWCPYCDVANWVDFGDENEHKTPEVEAMGCWMCNAMSVTDEDADFVRGEPGRGVSVVPGYRRPPKG